MIIGLTVSKGSRKHLETRKAWLYKKLKPLISFPRSNLTSEVVWSRSQIFILVAQVEDGTFRADAAHVYLTNPHFCARPQHFPSCTWSFHIAFIILPLASHMGHCPLVLHSAPNQNHWYQMTESVIFDQISQFCPKVPHLVFAH